MGSREGGEEVVERVLVRDVRCRQTKANLVLVTVKKIVFSECDVKEVPRLNARRIVVLVLGVGRGDFDEGRSETVRIALRKA